MLPGGPDSSRPKVSESQESAKQAQQPGQQPINIPQGLLPGSQQQLNMSATVAMPTFGSNRPVQGSTDLQLDPSIAAKLALSVSQPIPHMTVPSLALPSNLPYHSSVGSLPPNTLDLLTMNNTNPAILQLAAQISQNQRIMEGILSPTSATQRSPLGAPDASARAIQPVLQMPNLQIQQPQLDLARLSALMQDARAAAPGTVSTPPTPTAEQLQASRLGPAPANRAGQSWKSIKRAMDQLCSDRDSKRRQVARACLLCRQQKLKCDDERPCSRCTRRKVPCNQEEGDKASTGSGSPKSSKGWVKGGSSSESGTVAVAEGEATGSSSVDLASLGRRSRSITDDSQKDSSPASRVDSPTGSRVSSPFHLSKTPSSERMISGKALAKQIQKDKIRSSRFLTLLWNTGIKVERLYSMFVDVPLSLKEATHRIVKVIDEILEKKIFVEWLSNSETTQASQKEQDFDARTNQFLASQREHGFVGYTLDASDLSLLDLQVNDFAASFHGFSKAQYEAQMAAKELDLWSTELDCVCSCIDAILNMQAGFAERLYLWKRRDSSGAGVPCLVRCRSKVSLRNDSVRQKVTLQFSQWFSPISDEDYALQLATDPKVCRPLSWEIGDTRGAKELRADFPEEYTKSFAQILEAEGRAPQVKALAESLALKCEMLASRTRSSALGAK